MHNSILILEEMVGSNFPQSNCPQKMHNSQAFLCWKQVFSCNFPQNYTVCNDWWPSSFCTATKNSFGRGHICVWARDTRNPFTILLCNRPDHAKIMSKTQCVSLFNYHLLVNVVFFWIIAHQTSNDIKLMTIVQMTWNWWRSPKWHQIDDPGTNHLSNCQ